ncbi:MAG: TonB-dependent receptor [Pseudomonadota bacterium]
MMRSLLLTSTLIGTAGAFVGTHSPALAQEFEVEELVVTARKKEESLQDVPLSITALTSNDFIKRSINDLTGVALFTAGLDFDNFSNTFNRVVTIRGLTQANVQNRVQNVAVFLDGAFVPRSYSIDIGLMDLERVEVVKGPQSALYGQNAFAGAINYVAKKPQLDDFEASGLVTAGSAGRLDFRVSAGVPIVTDKLAVRGSYGWSEYGGTRTNSFPDVSERGEKLGGWEREAYNVALLARPFEGFELGAMYMETNSTSEIRPSYQVQGTDPNISLNCGPLRPTGSPTFFCGELPSNPSSFQTASSTRPDGLLIPDQPGAIADTRFIRANASYDFGNGVAINYIFADVSSEASEVSLSTNNPLSDFVLAEQKQGGENEFQSHEVRLVYEPDDGPLSGEIGYYNAQTNDDFVFGLNLLFGAAGPGLVVEDPSMGGADLTGFPIPLSNSTLDETIHALFGAIRYSFMDDRARLSFEARQDWVDVTFLDNVANISEQTDSFANFTPRFIAEYDLTDDTLLYASAARGAKAGGFNGFIAGSVTLIEDEQSFDSEFNWTYEIGTKNSFFDGRLTLNAALYYIDWSNQQITQQPTGFDVNDVMLGTAAPVIFLNVGSSRNIGIELEGQFFATQALTFNYAVSANDPKFKDGTTSGQFVGFCDDVICPADGDISGNALSRQSKFQTTIGAQYDGTLTEGIDYFARADFSYQSRQFVDNMNLAWVPGRTNVNASLGVSGERWSVTAWAENLFDQTFVTDSLFVLQFSRYQPSLNEGFRAGVTLTANY